MIQKLWLLLALLVALLAVGGATDIFAAPFCTVFSYGRQCYYYSYEDCLRAAGSQGACVINQDEVRAPPSSGAPFCVVTSFGTRCYYYDAASCQREAANSGGVCAVNPNR